MDNFRTVFITGGTGKIGSQLVKHFLCKDFNVIFTSRSGENIKTMLEKFRTHSHQNQLYGLAVDITEENSSIQILDFLSKNKIWPNSLINNARNVDYLKLQDNFMPSRASWMGEFLLDVVVPCELSMALAYHKDSELKSIINIASIYGVVPPNPTLYENPERESPINYSVAKSALIHLTKELAIRLADKKIRVNAISYGGVEGRVSEEFKKRYARLCPMGRMLKEEEVVGAVYFLVSEMSAGITGHNLVVDGGWTVW